MVNEMYDLLYWALILHLSQLVGSEREAAAALDFGTGVFALILFALSLFAWTRRKQPALAIVSLAFFLFFFTHVIEFIDEMGVIQEPGGVLQLALILVDFLILLLFFVAVVIRPKRKQQLSAS
jgi:hypothetical protein